MKFLRIDPIIQGGVMLLTLMSMIGISVVVLLIAVCLLAEVYGL